MAITVTLPSPIGTSSLKITAADLKTDCSRLNRRLNLMDTQTSQVAAAVSSLASQVSVTAPTTTGLIVLQDTHANRLANYPATKYPVGTIFIETDRGLLYVCRLDTVHGTNINQWWYESGVYFAPNASHPTDSGDLTVFDNNLLFSSTDFLHWHVWDGASLVFEFANGDYPGPSYPSPVALPAPAWAQCNGNPATVVQGDCSTITVTTLAIDVADAHGNYPMLMGGGTGAKAAAQDTFTTGAATSTDSTPTQTVQSGTGATVAGEPHIHTLDNTHSTLNPPGETSGPSGNPSGLPYRFGASFYMRC